MLVEFLRVFGIICIAAVVGKLISKLKLPAILGWLLTGIVFGPYLAGVVTAEITNETWFKVVCKLFECFAGVMIGREIIFKKLARSGKQIVGITFIQSIGTFLVVSAVFALTFALTDQPVYLAFVFGGIALATAPAPALSIVNEYHTDGPVTKTLIPLAAIDDVIGVAVFFTVISIISATLGGAASSPFAIIGMVVLPFVIGIVFGLLTSLIVKKIKNTTLAFVFLLAGLLLSAACGIAVDILIYHSFSLNYLLIGMAFSATVANAVEEDVFEHLMSDFDPILSLSLMVVVVNLGLPLDYRLIAGAGVYTAIYILSRAAGKIGGAYLGGKLTKAQPTVTKFLGLTLLPHSGVSLVFTGIAVSTLTPVAPTAATIVSGTIVAAAIINEIIAVILSKVAFKAAGEIKQ